MSDTPRTAVEVVCDLCAEALGHDVIFGEIPHYITLLKERHHQLERENARLLDALREICVGRLPEDYGRFDICCARLLGIAQQAIKKAKP